MASKKRKRPSDTDQSDRPRRAKSGVITAERESGTGTDIVAHSKEKEEKIAQKPATTNATRKRGRPPKDPTERPSKKPKPAPRRAVASSSSATPLPVPSTRAPSHRSKRTTRSSAHITIAPCAPSPQVEVTPRNSSSLQHYKYFSQVESTQASSARIPARSLPPSQSTASSSFRVTGEVPESESEPEDDIEDPSASFRSATHTTSQSASSQSDRSAHFTHESSTISTSPVASPLSPSFSIPETEPEIESSPAEQRTVEETVVEHESEAQPHEDSSREIPDTFETGGTLSTVAKSSGDRAQHSAQEETADASQHLAKESIVQVESSLEEELRFVLQSTPQEKRFEQSTQVELQDVPQSTAQEVEPFAQQRSQSVHRSFAKGVAPQGTQSPRPGGLQEVSQSTLEASPTREIPSTTQTLRTSLQLCGRQQSQTESEEQTTLLDPSTQTSSQPQVHERQSQSEESSANQVPAGLDEQPEASSNEVHAPQSLSLPSTDSLPVFLPDSRSTLRDTVALVPQVNNNSQTCSERQDVAKTTEANDDHSHLASPSQPTSRRRHGQLLPYDPVLEIQQQSVRVTRKTPEQYSGTVDRLTRHDSSQESPGLSCEDSSPVPQPPKQSLGTLNSNSNAPKRPETFADSFLNTVMNTNEHSSSPRREAPRATPGTSSALGNPLMNESSTGSSGVSALPVPKTTSEPKSWRAKFEETRAILHAKLEVDDKAPRRHEARRSEVRESESREPGSRAPSEAVEKIRNFDRLIAPETGTRSPSTIPDRLPVPQEPTSLRAVATSIPAPVPPAAHRHEEITTEPEAAEDVHMGEALYSDNEEDESLLVDDLELQEQEYIVPLSIQGRQADTYRKSSAALDVLYVSRAHHHQEGRTKIEEILKELRSIETHVDLVRVGNTTPQPNDDQLVQDKHLVQWSDGNSIKFRFLRALLSRLEARDLHVILLIDDENNARLFSIVESFLRGLNFSFESPSTGQSFSAANEPNKERKLLKVTILASTNSRVLREAHLIVCIDGKPNVTRIRKKPWALKPDGSGVPFLQMVIPRTVGHIDRYLSTKLDAERRLDTIITTLSQFVTQGSMGHAADDAPPRSHVDGYANEIVKFLLPSQDESALSEWPLPSLGNIKDEIEYQSQQSQEALNTASSLPGSNAAGKRPLIRDDDRDDPAKRMRFTPQPQAQASTSHVSDSEPATSLSIEQQLEWYKQENKRLREVTQSYVNRQWQYEEMSHKYRPMEIRAQRAENERDMGKERELKLREQLNIKTADSLEQRKNVEELRAVNLLSEDAKVRTIADQNGEIERLKDELAKETKAKEDAIAYKRSTETTLEYVQDQRREAQNAATAATQRADVLAKANEKLERAAKAKALLPSFNERQTRQADEAVARVTAERDNLKKQLRVQAEKNKQQATELERFKMTRGVGGGTRAASVGARTPRPGSRAASPLPNGRDRIANLRNG
ncbi:hypothetical protein P171DRAFT_470524 [Karstenula rhodostoma CBS 690.94]|uniref:Uncharacterized protein n=1 Tax=Karstenula rhodostoma CBS 690.94 TaxID=1392251 RepID=A0A9P4UGT5_9PLEO|nr:hypothetical protein P171DRAFT_470524 [Karstenula rhodostoma CBS 690.94]